MSDEAATSRDADIASTGADGHAPDKSPRKANGAQTLHRAEVSNFEIASQWSTLAADRLECSSPPRCADT